MSIPNERATTSAALVQVDPQRRALEARIEDAKVRLRQDLERASSLVRQATGTARRGVRRAAVIAGLSILGLAFAFALIRRRQRVRFIWR